MCNLECWCGIDLFISVQRASLKMPFVQYFFHSLPPFFRTAPKIVYRLIVMFLSTEIFSKRRKICAWLKRNQSNYGMDERKFCADQSSSHLVTKKLRLPWYLFNKPEEFSALMSIHSWFLTENARLHVWMLTLALFFYHNRKTTLLFNLSCSYPTALYKLGNRGATYM